ncbi:Uncharacterised protein [Vibrio cholerae]|nr:Uncharacterised protein [Vibrio cholerae]
MDLVEETRTCLVPASPNARLMPFTSATSPAGVDVP